MSTKRVLSKGDVVWVRPTYVTNPHDFYVRRVADDDWLRTFQEISEDGLSPAFTSSAPPELRSMVLLKHATYGWTRGSPITVGDDGKYSVYLLDYGETVPGVNINELRPLIFGGTRRPMAIQCRLHFCEPYDGIQWSSTSIAVFLNYLGKEAMKMTVMKQMRARDIFYVELQNQMPETVSTMMVIAKAARFVSVLPEVNRLQPLIPAALPQRLHYVFDSLAPGSEADVQVLGIEGNTFYVVRDERYAAYQSMTQLIEAEFETCEPLASGGTLSGTPVVCRVARNRRAFYFRGVIVSVSDDAGRDKALVHLVDRGGYESMPISENFLRESNSLLLEETTYAILCSLTEKQQTSNALHALLSPGVRLRVKAEKAGEGYDNPYIISILKEIVSKNYGSRTVNLSKNIPSEGGPVAAEYC